MEPTDEPQPTIEDLRDLFATLKSELTGTLTVDRSNEVPPQEEASDGEDAV